MLNVIHIEPSSRCTLLCPQCPRTAYLSDIIVQDCSIVSAVAACRGFDKVWMCGNHGDPIYHAEFHKLIAALRADQPHVIFGIVTNGAFRSDQWWKTTARLLQDSDSITFSIDGTPTTNHIYRVNSKWPTIESAIQILRQHGPSKLQLIWKHILFAYNEHALQDAVDLAKTLGFDQFTLVGSARNKPNQPLTPTNSLDSIRAQLHV